MSLFKLYNKSKKSINKSSINSKYAISFKAYELLKRLLLGIVQSEKLDNAYPKYKIKSSKNVPRSMQTFTNYLTNIKPINLVFFLNLIVLKANVKKKL